MQRGGDGGRVAEEREWEKETQRPVVAMRQDSLTRLSKVVDRGCHGDSTRSPVAAW